MEENLEARRRRRLVLTAAGAIDMLIGLALVLAGLGFLSAGPIDFGLPNWLALVVGAVLAFAGAAVVFYNFSRLDEG